MADFETMQHDGYTFMISLKNIKTLAVHVGWYIDGQGYFQVIYHNSLYGKYIQQKFGGSNG